MNIHNRSFTRAQLEERLGDISQLCGIQALACEDGAERGTRVLRGWNASGLHWDVLSDRCMDLGRLSYKAIPLTWSSGTGYVHPSLLQREGWPRGFHGGLLATCGLNNVGPECEADGERHEQHGRIARLPASQVTYATEWIHDQLRLRMEGIVDDRTSKGYHMRLHREILVEGDRSLIRLKDRVSNLGIGEEPCMIQYHMNFGFPLIDERTELLVPHAAEDKAIPIAALTTPVEARLVESSPDPAAWEEAVVRSPSLNLEVVIRYSADTLPYLWRWHDLRPGMRVLAVEPSNGRIKPRSRAREAASLTTLKPGDSLIFEIQIEVREIENSEV